MSNLKRFDPACVPTSDDGWEAIMTPAGLGKYVLYEDYERLYNRLKMWKDAGKPMADWLDEQGNYAGVTDQYRFLEAWDKK